MRFARMLFASLALLLALAPAAALAQTPTPWQFIDVTLHADQQRSLLLIAGELPDDAPLPYEAELAVPAGMEVMWFGEILRGAPEDDPELQYTKTSAGEFDIYRFTLTQSRIAQIEGTLPNVASFDGVTFATNLTYTAPQDVPKVRISARMPEGAQITQADTEAQIHRGGNGFSYYSKTVDSVKKDAPVTLAFAFEQPTTPVASNNRTSGSSAPTFFIALAVLGVFLLFGRAVLRKMSRTRESADLELAEDEAPISPVAMTATSATDSPAESEYQETAEYAETPAEEAEVPARRGVSRSFVLVLGVVSIFLVIIAVSSGANKPQLVNGQISEHFGSTSECASTMFAVTPAPGVDLEKRGADVVNAFKGSTGIGTVVLDVNTSTMLVRWCNSVTTPDAVAQALTATGLVTVQPINAAPSGQQPAPGTEQPDAGSSWAPGNGGSADSTQTP